MLHGNILITGGAGFLGRGILARAKREQWPCKFTIYSRDELKQHQCRLKYPDAQYVLGDIRDTDRLSLAMLHQDIVIHAAALKYVPESELNVLESVGINIQGSRNVGMLAGSLENGVHTCVLISTDKAVEPANTYGMTKAVAERIWYEYSRLITDVKYATVRYGNVIGSTGSVVPVFKRQAQVEGRVTVTNPGMTRFWIDIDEAINLILTSVLHAGSGCITIPTPKSMTLSQLVATVVPGVQVDIVGQRPGEKTHEKLLSFAESTQVLRKDNLHIFAPGLDRTKDVPAIISYELTSENAERMTPEQFNLYAEAAALV